MLVINACREGHSENEETVFGRSQTVKLLLQHFMPF